MSGRARVDAMKPKAQPATRTADPRPPDQFPVRGRYLGYLAFGACGALIMLVAFGILRLLRALGEGEGAWNAALASYANPAYLVFHFLALFALTWFAMRFFRVFPKTQPPRIGPFPRPPDLFFKVALNGGFVVASLLVMAVLGGALP
jgi:fumarate reductase subunit C